MTGIFELCSMSGFSNSGMAESCSDEHTAPLTTAGSGGCSTYCANCCDDDDDDDGVSAAAGAVAVAG